MERFLMTIKWVCRRLFGRAVTCVATVALLATLIALVLVQSFLIETQSSKCGIGRAMESTESTSAGGVVCECSSGRVLATVSPELQTEPIATIDSSRRESEETTSQTDVVPLRASTHSPPDPIGHELDDWNEGQLRAAIDGLKTVYGLSRVRLLDVGCGKMSRMSRFLDARDDIDYTGIDSDEDLVALHRSSFGNRPTWKFHAVDIVHNTLSGDQWSTNNGSSIIGHYWNYDLVFVRPMLLRQISTLSDVVAALRHLSAIRSNDVRRRTLLIAPTFVETHTNHEPGSGDRNTTTRPLNLLIPPISLVPPLCLDRVLDPVGYIGLWSLPLRRVVGCKKAMTSLVEFSGTRVKLSSCVTWSAYRLFDHDLFFRAGLQ